MIKIRPVSGFNAEIKMDNQEVIVDSDTTIQYLEVLAEQAPGQVRVEMRSGGYSITADVERKALELAGLSGFAAAKQTSKGYIEF